MATGKIVVSIDHAKCMPCTGQICIGVCPQGILEPNKNKKPHLVDQSACTFCEVCVNLCPTKAITMNRVKAPK